MESLQKIIAGTAMSNVLPIEVGEAGNELITNFSWASPLLGNSDQNLVEFSKLQALTYYLNLNFMYHTVN